jgi:hypothetical protein
MKAVGRCDGETVGRCVGASVGFVTAWSECPRLVRVDRYTRRYTEPHPGQASDSLGLVYLTVRWQGTGQRNAKSSL